MAQSVVWDRSRPRLGVMLRMAGLAGKVVILDEVHAADVYMSAFLVEGLRRLGQAGVPMIQLPGWSIL